MSTVTSASNSAGLSYATQLAQTSALNRSLYNLGAAIQSGDLTSANSILTAFIKANPQYATTSSDGSQSQSPINHDFQSLADAISNIQVDAARSAWTQVKSDLSKAGLTSLNSGTTATAQLVAQNDSSIAQQILSDTFGAAAASGGSSSVDSLLGGSSGSSGDIGLPSSLISSWVTYQNGGSAAPSAATASLGSLLNTSA
jgi:hypothetical protein